TRPFVTGKRPSSPRRGAGLLPRVERSRRRSATRGKSRELMSRPGGAAETCGVQCALPIARFPRPSGAAFICAPLTTGCARCARFTRGNIPPPLRGGLNIGDAFHGLRSLRSLHPWQQSFAPPGRNPCRRRFPRVALAALASPVATFLRPSGAARSVRVSRSSASLLYRRTNFDAPEGRWTVATGGVNPEGERNPWGRSAREWPPRRGGGNARRARRSG